MFPRYTHCLASHRGHSHLLQGLAILKIHGDSDFFKGFSRLLESLSVAADDHRGMDTLVKQLFSSSQQLSGQHHCCGGSVSNHVILSLSNLHHHLGRRVLHTDLVEDSCSVVGYGDVSEAVDKHFIHATRTQSGFYSLTDDSSSHDVVSPRVSSPPTRGTLFQDEDGLSPL